jgi:hypothetical protein
VPVAWADPQAYETVPPPARALKYSVTSNLVSLGISTSQPFARISWRESMTGSS